VASVSAAARAASSRRPVQVAAREQVQAHRPPASLVLVRLTQPQHDEGPPERAFAGPKGDLEEGLVRFAPLLSGRGSGAQP
jgi:hypothetical protein